MPALLTYLSFVLVKRNSFLVKVFKVLTFCFFCVKTKERITLFASLDSLVLSYLSASGGSSESSRSIGEESTYKKNFYNFSGFYPELVSGIRKVGTSSLKQKSPLGGVGPTGQHLIRQWAPPKPDAFKFLTQN